MKTGFSLCLIVLLAACQYEGIAPDVPVATRAVYYDFDSGAKLGEASYEYNKFGKLSRELYIDVANSNRNTETVYEFDVMGNLVKEKQRPFRDGTFYWVTEYTYSDRKMLTESYYSEEYPDQRTMIKYYYSNSTVPDSSVYSSMYGGYTSVYSYDDQQRKIRATNHGFGVIWSLNFTYQNDNLTSTCSVIHESIGDTPSGCTVNEYNSAGQLTKILEGDAGQLALKEERFYKDGLLDERRLYNFVGWDKPVLKATQYLKYEY
ncbi:MAG TPA: hypothetical protein VFE50_11660 [Cyclobacteriaceae bacterium]|nr:hypothetical protein [Cyclobacteriaceae bacterium]